MVLEDVKSLCGCLVDQALMSDYDGDSLLAGLLPPSSYTGLRNERREKLSENLSILPMTYFY